MNLDKEHPKIAAARAEVLTYGDKPTYSDEDFETAVDALIDTCRSEFSAQSDLFRSDLTPYQRAYRVMIQLWTSEVREDLRTAGQIAAILATIDHSS